ncbi:phosphoribosyl-ATP pyrophosphatase [Kaistella faecalis]|uniref:phosphoribosyl-ATP pyrophosphatase n=1 Tax=Kaistella faecalis TaxID=2852098 RepID=UPI001A26AC91|nr:phosphoribosyl-ATP pyrophosphatase [Chryseobacterium faecale]MBH1959870.1 phosphoribosyl-ATP pyrophosphatase [Flavobacteriia bacterium]MBH2023079.1 phosphoribosyl-ATP pyrophosphatase [Flavobacteriales bacterium]MBP3839499.1 phosphoribosyl-ATP pyrophosphatase [Chryseobacterium sp.]UFK97876.1 phosphoribosyl-ATP pyrophosphatase [Chryseobacterium faecale]
MGTKYSSLEELRRKKQLLKSEVAEIEDLITFDNTKESLSAFTNGFTDKYLKEEIKPDGETSVSLNTNEIVKEFSTSIKDTVLNRNAVYGFAKSDAGMNLVENALKIGAVTFVGNYARKSLYNTSWKKKIIGVALIYLAPIALRYVREKLENYQRNRTASSMEQLI